MPIYMKAIPLILIGVFLNAFAQIAMKKAVGAVGMEWSVGPLFRLFTSTWMLICLCCYAVSVVVWAGALKLVPSNFAFPFMALAFVCVALMAKYFLGETIPTMRWVALIVIVVGVCLQALSGEEGKKGETHQKSIPIQKSGEIP
jgi:multidrug transporter EmrE-like cation transporter